MIEDNIDLVSLRQIYSELLDNLAERLNDESSPVSGLYTEPGILDKLLKGIGCDDLIILASVCSGGKTSVALSIANKIKTEQNEAIMFFSYYETNVDFAIKFIAAQTDIKIHSIYQKNLTERDWDDIAEVIKKIELNNIYFQNFSVLSPDSISIALSALEVTKQKKVKAIFIDSLNDLEPNEDEKRKSIPMQLANLADKLQVPIFATTNLNRKRLEMRHNKRPVFTDMQHYKYVKAATDKVLSIFNPALYNDDLRKIANNDILNDRFEITYMKPSPYDD